MLGLPNTARIHFIGIGGIGMSGIAEVLLDSGYQISGSDLSEGPITNNLKAKGAVIHLGHVASHVEGAQVVVYSSAIDPLNPEWIRAQELELPLIKRGQMLAQLMQEKKGIAIAGSHGKTTTTSIVSTIFAETQLDPTFIIGGVVKALGGNAHRGEGEFLIAEADESDGSFLLMSPVNICVTNIDDDHLDHYGSKDKIVEAFGEFVNKLPNYGKVLLNADDSTSAQLKVRSELKPLWYGIDHAADYQALNIKYSAEGTKFDIHYQQVLSARCQIQLIGKHNVSNALAAAALSHLSGIEWSDIESALAKFVGVGRRLEKLYLKDHFLVLDDYGHHPTEIKATISALKQVDTRSLCVIFEPHRFTRTQNFWEEFKAAFKGADEVYISPIYAASEKSIDQISSRRMVDEMKGLGQKITYLESLEEMQEILRSRKMSAGIFLTLGAGPISKKIREMVAEL